MVKTRLPSPGIKCVQNRIFSGCNYRLPDFFAGRWLYIWYIISNLTGFVSFKKGPACYELNKLFITYELLISKWTPIQINLVKKSHLYVFLKVFFDKSMLNPNTDFYFLLVFSVHIYNIHLHIPNLKLPMKNITQYFVSNYVYFEVK